MVNLFAENIKKWKYAIEKPAGGLSPFLLSELEAAQEPLVANSLYDQLDMLRANIDPNLRINSVLEGMEGIELLPVENKIQIANVDTYTQYAKDVISNQTQGADNGSVVCPSGKVSIQISENEYDCADPCPAGKFHVIDGQDSQGNIYGCYTEDEIRSWSTDGFGGQGMNMEDPPNIDAGGGGVGAYGGVGGGYVDSGAVEDEAIDSVTLIEGSTKEKTNILPYLIGFGGLLLIFLPSKD
jgi:hypothetical protein